MMDGKGTAIASLTPEQEQRLKSLEQELGNVYLIAYEQPLTPAHLSDDQLDKVQDLERQIPGVVLVAYRKQKV